MADKYIFGRSLSDMLKKMPAQLRMKTGPALTPFGGIPMHESDLFPYTSVCKTCGGTGEGKTSTYCPNCKGAGEYTVEGLMTTEIPLTDLWQSSMLPASRTTLIVRYHPPKPVQWTAGPVGRPKRHRWHPYAEYCSRCGYTETDVMMDGYVRPCPRVVTIPHPQGGTNG